MSTISAGTTTTNALVNTGDTTGNLVFQTNGTTTAMTIDTSQNVGIGTSSPAARLEISQPQGTVLRITNTTAAGTTGNAAYTTLNSPSGNSGNFFRCHVATSDNGSTYDWGIGNFGTTTKDVLAFYSGGLTERMRIDSSGNVGIGLVPATSTTSNVQASGDITLYGSSRGFLGNLYYQSAWKYAGTGYGWGWIDAGSGNITFQATSSSGTAGASASTLGERMRFTAAGEVWMQNFADQGAYNLQVGGTGVWGAGAYVNGSDARIKDNIEPLQSVLDTVVKLNPVTFQYKESWSKDTSTQPGFIAQELQTALADTNYVDGVVQQGPEYMSVAYQTLIPVLTKAIQEQQAMITQLQAEVAALKGTAQ